MSGTLGHEERQTQLANTLWRLLAARGDTDKRAGIIGRAVAGLSSEEREALLVDLLETILTDFDEFLEDFPRIDELRVVIEAKAEMADFFDGLADL